MNLIHHPSEILLAPILMGLYCAYLILDDRTPEDSPMNKKLEFLWHCMGAAVFALFGKLYADKYGWYSFPLTVAGFWVLFAGIVHKVALRRPFFYVGETALTDQAQRWCADRLRLRPEIFSAAVKLAFLIGATILFTCKYHWA